MNTSSNDENNSDSSSSSSTLETISIYLLSRKRKRNIWVRPIFLERENVGEFFTLVPQLKNDLEKYRNYYRMSQECFNLILEAIRPLFVIGHTNFRKTISLEERLTVTVRYVCSPTAS